MEQKTSATPGPYYVLRVSRSVGQRVRAHVHAVKAAGGIETISHFVMKAIEHALAQAERGQS
jgi:hypothetical protein